MVESQFFGGGSSYIVRENQKKEEIMNKDNELYISYLNYILWIEVRRKTRQNE